MWRIVLVSSAASALVGCGIFFSETDGVGGGGASATSSGTVATDAGATTTGAGGAGCEGRVGSPTEWLVGYDQASVVGMASGLERLYFVGTALGGDVAGGLPNLASGTRMFLASLGEDGCGLTVSDLGALSENGQTATLSISERSPGSPIVTWSRRTQTCSFDADTAPVPGPTCDGSDVLFSCSASVRADGAVVAATEPPMLAMQVEGDLTCTVPPLSFQLSAGTYVFSSDQSFNSPYWLGSSLGELRASHGEQVGRFGALCEPGSTMLDGTQACGATTRPILFRIAPGDYHAHRLVPTVAMTDPAQHHVQPTRTGFTVVGEAPIQRQFVGWGIDPQNPLSFHDPMADERLGSAIDLPAGILVAGGATKPFGATTGADPVECPNNQPQCEGYAFWAVLSDTGLSADRSYAVVAGPAGCVRKIEGAAAVQPSGANDDVAIAMNATCGKVQRPFGESPELQANGFVILREAK